MRGEHGVEHLRDGALLGQGQRLDQFQLLPDLLLRDKRYAVMQNNDLEAYLKELEVLSMGGGNPGAF